jgi:quinol monooxygenase YgiN
MIVINVKVETNPGAVAALSQAIATMETASRAEAGCFEREGIAIPAAMTSLTRG